MRSRVTTRLPLVSRRTRVAPNSSRSVSISSPLAAWLIPADREPWTRPMVPGLWHLPQLGHRCRGMAGLLEQLADPARLVGRHHHAPAAGRQLEEPRPGPFGSAGQRRGRAVAGVLASALLEPLGGAIAQRLQRGGRVVRSGPRVGDLAGRHQARRGGRRPARRGRGPARPARRGRSGQGGYPQAGGRRLARRSAALPTSRPPRPGRPARGGRHPREAAPTAAMARGRRSRSIHRLAGTRTPEEGRPRSTGGATPGTSGRSSGSTRSRRRTARAGPGPAAPGGQASMSPPRCANSAMPVTSTTGS